MNANAATHLIFKLVAKKVTGIQQCNSVLKGAEHDFVVVDFSIFMISYLNKIPQPLSSENKTSRVALREGENSGS